MARFENAVLTNEGANLIASSIAEGFTIEFVKMVIGNGEYEDTEKSKEALRERTSLKAPKQDFGFSSVLATRQQAVVLKSVIRNDNLSEGYRMTEIGIIARKKGDAGTDGILYSIAVAAEADYLPDNTYPISYIQEYYTRVSNAEMVTINIEMGEYALAEDIQKILYPQYEESWNLTELKAGESLFLAFGKIKKAVSELMAHIGSKKNPHSVNKLQIDLGNVDNTSDMDKPVSTAVQEALNGKSDTSHTHTWSTIQDKPGTFPPSGHTHDDRYYTKSEVNSGYYSLKDAAEIPSGADLNSYTDFGNYVSTNEARSKTLKNCPWTGSGFKLIVERITGDTTGDYFKQRLIPNADECIEIIRHYVTGKGYTAWKRLIPGEYLPLSGGKLTGALNVGDKVNIRTDGEGGNLRLTSPQGAYWEMDAHNEDFRLYRQYNNAIFGFVFTKEGKFIDGRGFELPQIQRGSHTFNVGANSIAEQKITFPKSFSGTPTVVAGIYSSTTNTNYGQIIAAVKDITSTTCVLRVINRSSDALSPNVQWIAVL